MFQHFTIPSRLGTIFSKKNVLKVMFVLQLSSLWGKENISRPVARKSWSNSLIPCITLSDYLYSFRMEFVKCEVYTEEKCCKIEEYGRIRAVLEKSG